jgi:hypothetical protein
MIPLYYFLAAWLIFFGIYCIMALISTLQLVRLGLSGVGTFFGTALFLVVLVFAVLGMGSYLVTVDWHQEVNVLGWTNNSPFLNP